MALVEHRSGSIFWINKYLWRDKVPKPLVIYVAIALPSQLRPLDAVSMMPLSPPNASYNMVSVEQVKDL